jgi:hypothetical protein
MKGTLHLIWIFGMVSLFIAIVGYYTLTPFVEDMLTAARPLANFTDAYTNTSVHSTMDHAKRYWDMWPVAVAALLMLVFFIVASDDETSVRR